jgi:adenosylmethionine-8-amino-7-oxononanoate aminotransferase
VAPNCYRCPFSLAPEDCGIECACELERVIRMEGAESIAGFIAEPIVGAAGGAPVPPDGYFSMIRDICNRYDVVFIADEVITGWGRTGKRFGIEHWDVIPDVIVAAKGISSGYAPLGAVVLHDRIVNAFLSNSGHVEHNFTFAGNPLSCRAGLVALELMERQAVTENAAARGAQLLERLEPLRSLRFVGDVRGKGLLVGIEFVEDQATKRPFPVEYQVNQWVSRIALELGLVVYPGGGTADGLTGDHILLMPPLVISPDETDLLADKLTMTLRQFEKELRSRGD